MTNDVDKLYNAVVGNLREDDRVGSVSSNVQYNVDDVNRSLIFVAAQDPNSGEWMKGKFRYNPRDGSGTFETGKGDTPFIDEADYNGTVTVRGSTDELSGWISGKLTPGEDTTTQDYLRFQQ